MIDTILGVRTRATIDRVKQAVDDRTALALLDPNHPAAELERQRQLLATTAVPGDTAFVLFTSGSTAQPRGVVLSRSAVEAHCAASAAHLGWRDDDRWLLALSLAHTGGLAVVVRCHLANKPVELVVEASREALAAGIARSTIASLVPTQLAMLLDNPAWQPSPRLRAVLLGGAGTPPSLLEAAAARGVPFVTTYGMTETFGQAATAPLSRAGDPRALPVPLPGVGIDITPRIRVTGPSLATMYLDGAAIAPAFTTADLGELGPEGLRVIGRADDVIVTGGDNVQPGDVEDVLTATRGVRAACVFGIADARWGHIVGAAISIDPSFDRATASAHWHVTLPPRARPRELAIVDELPRLPSGKLDRRAAAGLPRKLVRYDVE